MSQKQKAPTITIKPSEEIVKTANIVETVVAGDMTIGLKKPNVLRQYQIVEVVGESAKNAVYMSMIMPLLWVVSIDGDDQPFISTKLELEALITRLGEDGIDAIMQYLSMKPTVEQTDAQVKN